MRLTRDNTPNKYAGGNRCTAIVLHQWDDPAKRPSFSGVVNWLKNPASQVSAHFVVSGDDVVQLADLRDRCWHARDANAFSIGIEIDPNVPGNTYQTVAELIRYIRSQVGNIPIQKHSDHVQTACPNFIDVARIVRESSQVLGASATTNKEQKLMTPNFIKETYFGFQGRYPSQGEIDFHMAKSSPESFVAGFKGQFKWKDLEDKVNVLNGKVHELSSLKITVAQLQESLQKMADLEMKEDIIEATKEQEITASRQRISELEKELELARTTPAVETPESPAPAPPKPDLLVRTFFSWLNAKLHKS